MPSLTAVVIGAGALGASTAYHLARRGASVTLVDRDAPGSQTSPRAAGLTNTKAAPTEIMARLTDEATETLARFEQETRFTLDFHRSGSVKAAYTEVGEARLLADLEVSRALGIEVDLITPAEAHRLAPWFEPSSPRAIGYVPSDAYLEPSRLAIAYVQLAQAAGAASCRSRRSRAAPGERPAARSLTPRSDLPAPWWSTRPVAGRGQSPRRPGSACRWCQSGTSCTSPSRSPRSSRAADRPLPGGERLRSAGARRSAGRRVRG